MVSVGNIFTQLSQLSSEEQQFPQQPSKMKFVSFLTGISFNLIDFYFTIVHWQIVAVAFLAVALAAPQGDKKPIEIVSSNSEMNADGSYSFE